MHCGSGFWRGQRPSPAHYVTGMGPMDGATAAGGRSCCLSSDSRRGHPPLANTAPKKLPQPETRPPTVRCVLTILKEPAMFEG